LHWFFGSKAKAQWYCHEGAYLLRSVNNALAPCSLLYRMLKKYLFNLNLSKIEQKPKMRL
jgi:hypothetical protein